MMIVAFVGFLPPEWAEWKNDLRRMPLATMSPASTPSLLNRCRLGLRINEFIHSPVAASTDLLFCEKIKEKRK
ncbi:hypothetical protein OUZ56_031456 [Daphnia magna]|uniref:Secreted protein n=1 Tax=Daphnia magna TaxID=35525 RepID=A0ABQ9ZUB0_9CRUS|nr:hypothetical protein OUZ56_031456 [Daphnia magna]